MDQTSIPKPPGFADLPRLSRSVICKLCGAVFLSIPTMFRCVSPKFSWLKNALANIGAIHPEFDLPTKWSID